MLARPVSLVEQFSEAVNEILGRYIYLYIVLSQMIVTSTCVCNLLSKSIILIPNLYSPFEIYELLGVNINNDHAFNCCGSC